MGKRLSGDEGGGVEDRDWRGADLWLLAVHVCQYGDEGGLQLPPR